MKKILLLVLIFILNIFITGCAHLSEEDNNSLKILKKTNKEINSFKYISDKDNYGVEDYFASSKEFYSNKGGDCEDYAIAKYDKLIELGFNKDSLSFLLLQNKNEYHMVLSVFINDKEYILDNIDNEILTKTLLRKSEYKKLDYYSFLDISKYISKDKNKK